VGNEAVETEKKETKRSSFKAEPFYSEANNLWLLPASRRAKRRMLRRLAVVLDALARLQPRGRAGILMYHRVAESAARAAKPTWNVTPAELRCQLEGLRELGCEPIPLGAVLRANATGEALPPRSFVVTFDDGYENFYTAALPILHDLKIPATVFLATAYVDTSGPFPFDDWMAAGSILVPQDSWRPMTLQQCKELRRDPLIEIGAHTHTHRNFRGDPGGFEKDLRDCLQFLQLELAVKAAAFAFPFGLAGADLLDVARRAGVLCALTTEEELVNPQSEPFGWGRFIVAGYDTPSTLAACLGGWYSELRRYSPGAAGQQQYAI
jgi:peptidoglycan/xylan/chitin deacetylase (PgdA/CDA1 family)